MDLWTRIKSLGSDEEHEDERCDLIEQQRKRAEELRPRVSCCAAGKANIRAYLPVDYNSDIYPTHEAPYWILFVRDERGSGYESRRIRFCPWCATEVPMLDKRPDSSEHYTRFDDGGYYCAECGDRLGCFCLPAECAWKVRVS